MAEQPRYGVWPWLLPFVAFMLISMLEPGFPTESQDLLIVETSEDPTQVSDRLSEAEQYVRNERKNQATRFFMIYSAKVLVTTCLLVFFWRGYLSQFPFQVSWLALVVGAVGVVVWVGFCQLGIEQHVMGWFTTEDLAIRSQFNPFSQLNETWQLYGFLFIRFFGLVIMVPICEELLLRGLLMRYIESPEWWSVSLARLSFRTLLVAPLYGMLTHPTEALAAIAWFSLVTWLVQRTGKFWDAVLAHAVTNLLLGIYICLYSQWQLW